VAEASIKINFCYLLIVAASVPNRTKSCECHFQF